MYEDYDEYEPSVEELEECDGRNSTQVKMEEQTLHIDFNVENFANGIAGRVQEELYATLYDRVVEKIREEILEDLRKTIKQQTGEIIRSIIVDFMENEKLTIGGDIWGNEPKQELTMLQDTKQCTKEIIETQKFEVVTGIKTKKDWNGKLRYSAQTEE